MSFNLNYIQSFPATRTNMSDSSVEPLTHLGSLTFTHCLSRVSQLFQWPHGTQNHPGWGGHTHTHTLIWHLQNPHRKNLGFEPRTFFLIS